MKPRISRRVVPAMRSMTFVSCGTHEPYFGKSTPPHGMKTGVLGVPQFKSPWIDLKWRQQ